MRVQLNINGSMDAYSIRPDEFLLETLRNNHFYSVKKGCETTSCGVCTVLVDGKPVASCSYLTVRAEDHEITTVEGIEEEAGKLANFFGEEGADQCGFCNPALALTVYAMKNELDNPTDDDIRHYLVGNLCRCTGYIAQHKAIRKYMEVRS